ncbi:MAG: hypothetical protein AB7G12_14660 [Thermoanaerobaculia bacterium]
MKTLLRAHRLLGAFAAPMLILFAISGSWQLLNIHKSKRDGSYKAPAVVKTISDVHMGEDLEGPAKWAFRGIAWLVAASLVVTSSIGLFLAFKLDRGRAVLLAVLAGVLLPLILFLVAHE